jgi:hypothetical protein
MRNCACVLAMMVAAFLSIGSLVEAAPATPEVKLTVMNPRGEITPLKVFAPRARISNLSNKKIGIYWNGKAGGNYFWNIIEQLLKEKLPTATILRYDGAYDIGDPLAAKVASEVDAFFYGVGD